MAREANRSLAPLQVVEADLNREEHQRAVVELVDAYARDPMGDGQPLSGEVRRSLIAGLRRHPTTVILLAYWDAEPAGIAVCFRGFSTFAARPLLNIHDLAVLPDRRGRGIGRRLLEEVERKARELDCCKITLEVRTDNDRARRLYEASGFGAREGRGRSEPFLFLSKPLSNDA